jgi:hypothetical protein
MEAVRFTLDRAAIKINSVVICNHLEESQNVLYMKCISDNVCYTYSEGATVC